MDKWYISDNGRVAGPLDIDDVERLIAKNSDLYGWNPSYSHWLPIDKIKELSGFLPEDYAADQVSKELIDKFVTKKRELNKKARIIDSSIEGIVAKMALFEQEIENYKTLTAPLSPDVQENIVPLEKKRTSVEKQLNDLLKALAISKQEINDVVKEFSEMVLNKSTENLDDFLDTPETMPAKKAVKPSTSIERSTRVEKSSAIEKPARANTAKPTEDTAPAPAATAKRDALEPKKESEDINKNVPLEFRGTVVNYGKTSNKDKNTTDSKEDNPSVIPIRKDAQDTAAPEDKSKDKTHLSSWFSMGASSDSEEKQDDAGKADFKSKLKSVFGKHNSNEDLGKLSDRLRMLEQEADEQNSVDEEQPAEEVVFLDYDVESESGDDSDLKKKHRRRRRI